MVFYACTFLISKGLSVLFHLKGDRASVYRAFIHVWQYRVYGHSDYLQCVPRAGHAVYFRCFTIIDQLVLWTLGVKLTTPGGQGSFQPKKMINPCTVAVVLALLMVVSGLSLPPLLHWRRWIKSAVPPNPRWP